jgi:hypothetical protein
MALFTGTHQNGKRSSVLRTAERVIVISNPIFILLSGHFCQAFLFLVNKMARDRHAI